METADHQWGSSQHLQSLFSGTWIPLCSSRFILSVCRQSQCTSRIHKKNFFPFYFPSQFLHAATCLIQEGQHFCRTHVLSDSVLHVHKILGNKTVKKFQPRRPCSLTHAQTSTFIYLHPQTGLCLSRVRTACCKRSGKCYSLITFEVLLLEGHLLVSQELTFLDARKQPVPEQG